MTAPVLDAGDLTTAQSAATTVVQLLADTVTGNIGWIFLVLSIALTLGVVRYFWRRLARPR